MQVYEELVARGLIAQVTNEEEIRDMVNNGKATFYIGFDPTADSLHVGHFMALCLMKRLQMAGNKPIALVGGGTAMIGDPSGRTDLRQMMTPETIQHNVDCFKKQMSRFIDFSEGKAILVNNADWLMDLNYIEVLRDVGAHFSVNRMLSAECYKQRMEKGLSFLEFNYMIMQSYDFYKLFQDYGCNMQFGGDDQWSNMLGGTELIRRKLGKDAHAMTITLLLNSEGKKMGKTAKGAVWLDPEKTSPFEFYQYWRNVDDSDVLKCIRMLTFLPLEEIDAMSDWEGAQLNKAKEILEAAGWAEGDDGIREKDGARAEFTMLYPASDSVRQALAEDSKNQLAELGIEVTTEGVDWDTAYTRAESEPLVWGWGAHTPMELYNIYHTMSETGLAEYSPYANETVDKYMDEALKSSDLEASYDLWKKAQWDGENGIIQEGDIPWIWLCNIDHLYFVKDGLKVADQKIHPHGHGWSIVNNVDQWSWE